MFVVCNIIMMSTSLIESQEYGCSNVAKIHAWQNSLFFIKKVSKIENVVFWSTQCNVTQTEGGTANHQPQA